MSPLVFVDIETTGTSAHHDRIIEVGGLRVEDGKIIKTYKSLVNPQSHLSPYISYMTGISSEDLEQAPTFSEIKDELYEFLHEGLFIAHNVRFDYSFLKNEFERHGVEFQAPHCCTVRLSRHFYPQHQHHGLDRLIERYSFSCENRHRAYDDAEVLWQFYQHLTTEFTEEKVNKAIEIMRKTQTTPAHINPEIVQNLPNSAGVYLMYDQQKTLLYVGKSKHIKDRVMSHFSADQESEKEMTLARQVHAIDTISTCGEIGSLLLEHELVKELKPIYNHVLRENQEGVAVVPRQNAQGYFVPQLIRFDDPQADPEKFLALYKTDKKAKQALIELSKDQFLCEKLMKQERYRGPCFSHKLGVCQGACAGVEDVESYNARFLSAFERSALGMWPFKGPIVFIEENAEDQKTEGLLFHRFCYVGRVIWEGEQMQFSPVDAKFDADVYKILRFALRTGKPREVKQTPQLAQLL